MGLSRSRSCVGFLFGYSAEARLLVNLTALTLSIVLHLSTYASETDRRDFATKESGSLSEPLDADTFIDGVIAIAETQDLNALPEVVMHSLHVSLSRDSSAELIKGQEAYFTTAEGISPAVYLSYNIDMVHLNIQLHYPARFITTGDVGCLKFYSTNAALTSRNWVGRSMPIIGDIKVYSKQEKTQFIQLFPPGGLKADRTCIGNIAIRFPKAS